MDPSDEILREVGRVAIFGAKLEDAHAWMLAALTDRPMRESLKMSTSALRKQIARAANEHVLDEGLRGAVHSWLADARSVLDERHAVVHSYARGHFVGGELVLSQWVPRLSEYREFDPVHLHDLALRLGGVAARSLDLMFQVAGA